MEEEGEENLLEGVQKGAFWGRVKGPIEAGKLSSAYTW